MADRFVDFETKICADWLNTVDDAVIDALGSPQTPTQARQNIGAVEEAPQDASPYVRVNASWQTIQLAVQHNELGGRSASDAHPQESITGLDSRLTAIEDKNASQDTNIAAKATVAYVDSENDLQDAAIALKADKSYVDSQNSAQDAVIATKASTSYVDSENDAQDLLIAAKADKSYVDSQNSAQDAVIATKASITYVDQQNAIQDSNTLALIVALG